MKFKGRLMLIILVPTVFLCVCVAYMSVSSVKELGEKDIKSELCSFAYSTLERYEAIEGDAYEVDTKALSLKKGDTVITADTSAIDNLKSKTDIDTTVFVGEKRAMTTIMNSDGKPIIGTPAGEEVIKTVLDNGEEYFANEIVINETDYAGYYVPLVQKNSDEVIGMIFSGKARVDIESAISKVVMKIIIFAFIILLLSIIGTGILSNRMAKAMNHVSDEMGKLARGNLKLSISDSAVHRTDEIGDVAKSSSQVVAQLTQVITNIVNTSTTIEEFSEKFVESFQSINDNIKNIDNAVTEIANGATSQAEETQTASQGVNIIGNAVDDTVTNVNGLSQSASKMKEYNATVRATLEDLAAISDSTKESVSAVYEQTNATNHSANEIRIATDLITEIASQTNLLSLNASIEAARAGENGKGFAVVADEIRNLSEQSKESADTIMARVQELLSNSALSVSTMNDMSSVIVHQNQVIEKTKQLFVSLNEEIGNVSVAIEEIGQQIKRLDEAKCKVVDVVENLSSIAEENAASAEETSASMNELEDIVRKCSAVTGEMVELSKELVEGTSVFQL